MNSKHKEIIINIETILLITTFILTATFLYLIEVNQHSFFKEIFTVGFVIFGCLFLFILAMTIIYHIF